MEEGTSLAMSNDDPWNMNVCQLMKAEKETWLPLMSRVYKQNYPRDLACESTEFLVISILSSDSNLGVEVLLDGE